MISNYPTVLTNFSIRQVRIIHQHASHVAPATTGEPYLLAPKTDNKPTLVLDLDETLVHCSLRSYEYAQCSFLLETAQQ